MIRLDQISKQHGRQILFVEASAAVHRGEKVGLVGPNGAGKTTIFRLITRRGAARRRPGLDRSRRHHRLLQPGRRRDGRAPGGRRGDGRRRRRSPRSPPSCAQLERRDGRSRRAPTRWTRCIERFGEAQARFEELGGYALEARAREILAGLGFCAGDDGRRRRRALRRLEDARRAGAHPADAARRAAARRADQPPRHRVDHLARALPRTTTRARC